MSEHWPPEWEDTEEEFSEQADQLDAAAEAQLSEVTAFLASVSVPTLPDTFEARISAALAAEAATRADHSALADGSRKLGPKPKRARVKRQRGSGRSWRDFTRPALAGASVLACLFLVGLVITLSHSSSSSSSYSSLAGAPAAGSNQGAASSAADSGTSAKSSGVRAVPAPSPVSASASSTSAHGTRATTAVPRKSAQASASSASASLAPTAPAPTPTTPAPTSTASVSFVVTASGTNYRAATLASQVRARLNASGGSGASPSAALRGCVSYLTGGQSPRLVDQATYQGSPAYVIATSSQAWVVGLACTAAKPELVTSVPLAG
jgi:hypothetical protein